MLCYMINLIGKNQDYTRKAKNIIKKYGDKEIQMLRIHRTPLSKFLMGTLNVFTLGDFTKKFKNTPYDELFHLRVDMFFEGSKVVSLEKNEVITFTEKPKSSEKASMMNVELQRKPTLNELLAKTQQSMGNKYFLYSAKSNNCQDFILALFRSNGLLTKEREDFIKQDTKSLFTPKSRKLANTITDVAAKAKTLIGGGNKKSNDEYIMMDKKAFMKDMEDLVDKHTKTMEGAGLASELAKTAVMETAKSKAKGEKSFMEKSNKEKGKEVAKVAKVAKQAPKMVKDAFKKIIGKGADPVKVQEESVSAPKKKRGKFVKGSPEAREWGRMMAEKRKQKRAVGGKDSLPPSKKRTLKGAGVKEDAEEYAKNPLLAGFDAGVAIAPVLAGENPKSKKNRAIKRDINKNERKKIKEAGKYINPVTLLGLS